MANASIETANPRDAATLPKEAKWTATRYDRANSRVEIQCSACKTKRTNMFPDNPRTCPECRATITNVDELPAGWECVID